MVNNTNNLFIMTILFRHCLNYNSLLHSRLIPFIRSGPCLGIHGLCSANHPHTRGGGGQQNKQIDNSANTRRFTFRLNNSLGFRSDLSLSRYPCAFTTRALPLPATMYGHVDHLTVHSPRHHLMRGHQWCGWVFDCQTNAVLGLVGGWIRIWLTIWIDWIMGATPE